MSTEKIDLAAVIADLETKRSALDTAITSLRMVIASGALGSSDGVVSGAVMPLSASGGEVPDGAFHGRNIPAAIKLYLEIVRKKQTAREIADGLKKGGVESTSRWFEKTIYSTLDRLRRAGDILKLGGHWGLPEWYTPSVRAGLAESGRTKKLSKKLGRRTKPRKAQLSVIPLPQAHPTQTLEVKIERVSKPTPRATIEQFMQEHPGPHTTEEIKSETRITEPRIAAMLLGQLVAKGKLEKTKDGKFQAAR